MIDSWTKPPPYSSFGLKAEESLLQRRINKEGDQTFWSFSFVLISFSAGS